MNESRPDMLTCVVLTTLDRSIDPSLYATLAARAWTPRVEHEPRMAMAEACLVRRELQLRAAWQDLGASMIPGLILLGEDQPEELKPLQSAMARHVPEIPIWTVRSGDLVPINEAALQTSASEAVEPMEDDDVPSLVFHPGDESRRAEPLSREEVSMLLHDPDDQRDRDDPEST